MFTHAFDAAPRSGWVLWGLMQAQIAAGDLAPLGEWLRDRVHRHGRRLTPAQILERAGCGELSVRPLLDHLQARAAGD